MTKYKPCDCCEHRKALVLYFNESNTCNACRDIDRDGNPLNTKKS